MGGKLVTVAQYRAYLNSFGGANTPTNVIAFREHVLAGLPQGRDAGAVKSGFREPADDVRGRRDLQRANDCFPTTAPLRSRPAMSA